MKIQKLNLLIYGWTLEFEILPLLLSSDSAENGCGAVEDVGTAGGGNGAVNIGDEPNGGAPGVVGVVGVGRC